MNCPICEGVICPDFKYCAGCGWELGTCPNCHKQIPAISTPVNYCPYCRTTLPRVIQLRGRPVPENHESGGGWQKAYPEPESRDPVPDPWERSSAGEVPYREEAVSHEYPSMQEREELIHVKAGDFSPFDLKYGLMPVDDAKRKMGLVLRGLGVEENSIEALLILSFPNFSDI